MISGIAAERTGFMGCQTKPLWKRLFKVGTASRLTSYHVSSIRMRAIDSEEVKGRTTELLWSDFET
jgi:hypothetical protein